MQQVWFSNLVHHIALYICFIFYDAHIRMSTQVNLVCYIWNTLIYRYNVLKLMFTIVGCITGLNRTKVHKQKTTWAVISKSRASRAGDRLNIKISSYQYRDSYVKDKTVSPTILSWTWQSPCMELLITFCCLPGQDLDNTYNLPVICDGLNPRQTAAVDEHIEPNQRLFETY